MPQVSVIIPLYNKGPYIRRALDSVLAQTFGDFECVVVDDGSTDDGPEIVKSYSDPRMRLIQQANAGPGAARNRGVRESTAPYVAFLDADDEWLPDFLRVSLALLASHPECTVSVTSHYAEQSRKDLTPFFVEAGLREGIWHQHTHCNMKDLEQRRLPFMVGAVVCRRDVFDKYGGFYDRERVTCGEDIYLWLQLLVNCTIFFVLRPLAWYHREASELCPQRRDTGVLQPYLADPSQLFSNCPPPLRGALSDLLCKWAFRRASELCARQDVMSAKAICRALPMMRHHIRSYAKLRLKLAFPQLYRVSSQ